MVNINAHLPPSVAAAFHPPTEGLQHDNVIKPVIPKTDIIASYTKMRDDQERTQFSSQARDIIQDQGMQTDDDTEQNSSSGQRRSRFFALRAGSLSVEAEQSETKAVAIEDFKLVVSVIQARYKSAVSPFSEPIVSYTI